MFIYIYIYIYSIFLMNDEKQDTSPLLRINFQIHIIKVG
jgi:hypothetical protein